jgi:hypothetical protein
MFIYVYNMYFRICNSEPITFTFLQMSLMSSAMITSQIIYVQPLSCDAMNHAAPGGLS